MKTKVADVMTTEVVSACPATPFRQLAATLTSLRISAIPVVDLASLVVGVVSEGDLMLKELPPSRPRPFESGTRRVERSKAQALVAADLMTSPAITIHADATLSEAARLMHDRRVKRLPVVDDEGRLLGIVTRGDLLSVFTRADDDTRREIIDEVVIRALWMDPRSFAVTVKNGLVTLTGKVDRRSDVGILTGLIRGVDGVVGVSSELGFDFDDMAAGSASNWAGGLLPRRSGLGA